MRLRQLWDDLKTSLWFRPALWVIGLGALALALTSLDENLERFLTPDQLSRLSLIFGGGPEAARTLLGAVSASMLTVATLAYSIAMVAIVQTANAFSPRILRHYLGDTVQQHVLGVLMGTFLYCLLVLRVVGRDAPGLFVPTLSITVAVVLALLSLASFIYFIHHVSHSIEVRHIVKIIRQEAEDLFDEVFPETLGRPWPQADPPPLPTTAPALVRATRPGYIQFIAPDEMLAVARDADVLVRLEPMPGDYVLPGLPLASVWPAEKLTERLADSLRGAVEFGSERTLAQDLLFSMRQLSDIALRALSPAVNDPSTAMNCMDVMGSLLTQMALHPPVTPYRCDADGVLRVIARGPTFDSMLDQAFNQIRHYAATDLACTWRLLEVCGQLGHTAPWPGQREALWRHVTMVARSADRHLDELHDRVEVNRRLREAAESLGQDATDYLLSLKPPESAIQAVP